TSAQQLDASFSTSASLELFEFNLADPSLAMKSCGTLSSSHRYHKLVWSPFGIDGQGLASGVLIAGGENGNVILYDPVKIMSGDTNVIIAESDIHTGPVRALDLNPFQTNLVASGGNESEIYIWDINNFGSPMTPGPKTQPLEDISCVAWNRQVQHILASTSPSGRTSVWDLRKNDLIIKVSDHSNRMHCSGMAWNPEVATQLVMSSEDDRMPVIQMWDLRFASSPLKILENHTRGVLAIAWSYADPELLLSCGKDGRILCWNPNTAEILYELPTGNHWCFDIQWCPRNPAVLSAASFNSCINIYSIMGGTSQAQSHVDEVSHSFGTMDPFGTGQTLPLLELPQSGTISTTVNPIKKPPKWIQRPVGASFAFGGKLVSLENGKPNPQLPNRHVVHVSQVVTETDLLKRSSQLQDTISSGQFVEFCQGKINMAENDFEKTIWSFLKANFDSDTRSRFLELLGYNREELALKVGLLFKIIILFLLIQMDLPPLCDAQPVADLNIVTATENPEAAFDLIAAANLKPSVTQEMDYIPLTESEETIEVNAEEKSADHNYEIVDQVASGIPEQQWDDEEILLDEVQHSTRKYIFRSNHKTNIISNIVVSSIIFSSPTDVDRLITQALLTGDFEGAVELCLLDNRMADSIILAIAGGAELLEKTQKKYFIKSQSKLTKLISAVVMKDLHDILSTCDLQNWKEAMAAVMTYAQTQEFSSLCDLLGGRLEGANDPNLQAQACLCYICAGNLEKLVSCWIKAQEGNNPLSLQDLVEKVVVMRHAVEQMQNMGPLTVGVLLAKKMGEYANLLASQGCLTTAITYLPNETNHVCIQLLRERLSHALGQQDPASFKTQSAPSQVPPLQTLTAGQSNNAYSVVQPTTTAPAHLQYYQPVRAASTVTSWSNQTPTVFPHVPPSLPVGTASDPSKVTPSSPMCTMPTTGTAAALSASSAPFIHSHQYQTYAQVNQYPQGVGGLTEYRTHQDCPPVVPVLAEASVAPHPPVLSHYSQPVPFQTAYAPSPLSSKCPSFSSSSNPPSSPSSMASFQHGGPGSPGSYMLLPPQSGVSGPQNGWNDPPTLSRGPKKKIVPENYTPPAPITTPIMAPLGANLQPQQMPSGSPQLMGQIPHAVQTPYSGMQQPLVPSALNSMNTTMPKTSSEGAPGAPIGDVIQPPRSMPAEKITKKPIPDEHFVLKTTFEGLIQKCLIVATDPQTKRKLDDANKRLETLYDKLREHT
ncbi:hypothetical protein NL108_009184, partial [Boleophthalmus pectinirostris]